MTWKTLLDLLSAEFRRLRKMPVVSFGFSNQPVTSVEELRAKELAVSERLDRIVRDFARSRRWPALDEKERFFLRERIRFAYEYAALGEISLNCPVALAERRHVANEQRRVLEWLLIDLWRKTGVVTWLEPLVQLEECGTLAAATDWQIDISA